MGSGNTKYIKSLEDKVESSIKKGLDLKQIQDQLNINVNTLCEIRFQPNNWNIFHLACWYSNENIIHDLIKWSETTNPGNPDYPNYTGNLINMPDKNGEPPVLLSCIIDNVQVFKLLIEIGKCKTEFNSDSSSNQYRKELELDRICVIHDSVNCFRILYENHVEKANDEKLDDLYNLAKYTNSENVVRLFESEKIEMDFDYELFAENQVDFIQL